MYSTSCIATRLWGNKSVLVFRCWRMLGLLFLLLSLLEFSPTLCHAGEVRGTWLTTTANDAIMNPLHPEVQQFLLDQVLEAIDHYDLDGIQMDDRIVWPYVTMGYDAYTKQIYANEHQGKAPPQDAHDPAWMAWRADKINAFAKRFTLAIRAKRPGLILSLSPAVYPWSWQHYLLAWPAWSAWGNGDTSTELKPSWDEFIPQAYRLSYRDFASTWQQQVDAVRAAGGNPHTNLLAGIRIVGDGPDASWQQLRDAIELTRTMGNVGHVLWFSHGVLDLYHKELQGYYAQTGKSESPHFPTGWREAAIPLTAIATPTETAKSPIWTYTPSPTKPIHGTYCLIGFDGEQWDYVGEVTLEQNASPAKRILSIPVHYQQLELIRDRRVDRQSQLR